jgi:hypothetical protein
MHVIAALNEKSNNFFIGTIQNLGWQDIEEKNVDA